MDSRATSTTSGITLCNNCILCKRGGLNTNGKFYCNISNKEHIVDFNASCLSERFIYLITCKHPGCLMKYTGKSTCTIRKRMYGHRNNLTAGKEPHLVQHHFTKVHQPSDMFILPIELVEDGKILGERETYWMREINTIFPYGLNDRTDINGIHDAYTHIINNRSALTIYSLFNKVTPVRGSSGRQISKRRGNEVNIDCDIFLKELIETVDINPFNFTRKKIMSLTKQQSKDLYLYIIRNIDDNNVTAGFNEYFLFMVKDISLFKLQRYHEQVKSTNFNFLVVNFSNKLIENVNLKSLLKDPVISSTFPHSSNNMKMPNITYSYTTTIRSNIVNYRQTIQNLDNLDNITCACSQYGNKYVNNAYGHIFTSDLDIIENNQLRALLQKGLNYRDQQLPDRTKAFLSIESGVDSYIKDISNKISKPINSFAEWRDKILNQVKEKLCNMNLYKFCSVLRNSDVKKALADLQSDFVFTPVDKASNNVSIVCKKFYVQTLQNEIENSNTFININLSEEEIFEKHRLYYEKLEISYLDEFRKFPYLYWISKMHKNPSKFRFITCGIATSVEHLSKIITPCLKTLVKSAKKRARYKNAFKPYNDFFIVDDRQEIINFIDNSNFHRKRGGSKNIRTYDFSNLYTSIPHQKLKCNIHKFVEDTFQAAGKLFINVKNNKAFLSNKIGNGITFNARQLVEAISFIIDNSYITFNGYLYQQVIGIPMGTSCAPYIANIFLHVYEKDFISNLITNGKTEDAIKLSNTFRFQDDIIVMNDNGYFDTIYKDMYPGELTLVNTNLSPCCATFLDLGISLHYGKFKYHLYDKRKDFNFSVINYPFLSGNIPKIPSYGIYVSQLLRLCRICSKSKKFLAEIKNLNRKLVSQGFVLPTLKRKFKSFCNKYIHIWGRYGVDLFGDDALNYLF